MKSVERVKAALAHKPVDRVCISGWKHFPLVDMNVKDFVKATIDYTDNNGFDFIKVMFNTHFHATPYGANIIYSTNPLSWAGKILEYPLAHPHDFATLEPFDVAKSSLQLEIEVVKRLADHYKGEVPVIGTMFSPMTSILEMSSIERDQLVRKMMAYSPKELEHAIETITQTNIDFGKKMIEAGADGIFYATHWATTDRMTKEQHDTYCRPYDLKILDEMNKAGGWFSMMHVHGRQNLMFDWILDYPVQSYNWEDVECASTKGSLADVSAITDKVLIAGINLWEDLYNENNDREAIKAVLKNRLVNALKDCKDNTRFIFAPGCGFPLDLDNYVFTLIQEVADEVSVK